jgi:hypothetical protein
MLWKIARLAGVLTVLEGCGEKELGPSGPSQPTAHASASNADSHIVDEVPIHPVTAEYINSLARVLYELAGERYAANSKNNQTWILAVHSGASVRKYSDTNFIILSFPVINPEDQAGLCVYTHQYNSLNIQRADLEVKAGRYSWARAVYETILRFESCHDGFKKEIERRLHYLERLERGQDTDTNLKEFMALYDDLFFRMNLADIEGREAEQVQDVRNIPWPP